MTNKRSLSFSTVPATSADVVELALATPQANLAVRAPANQTGLLLLGFFGLGVLTGVALASR